jgi:hypothetical protein
MKDIDTWFEREQRKGDAFRRLAQGIASNLGRCSKDSIIRDLPDSPGKRAYGQEYVWGTTESGRLEPINLIKIPVVAAKKMLHKLPEKEFPN